MKVLYRRQVPTGDILVVKGKYGLLECLSLGDYGKDVNIKCDALGLSREPSPVRHTKLLPLTEKWVITISTQTSCAMKCHFCFLSGSKVNTPNGLKNIEDLVIGETVYGYDTTAKSVVVQQVTQIFKRVYSGNILKITLSNDRVIYVTPDHKFYTQRGWVSAHLLNDTDDLLEFN